MYLDYNEIIKKVKFSFKKCKESEISLEPNYEKLFISKNKLKEKKVIISC